MHIEDCNYLGYISKAIGFEGSLLTFFEAADPSSFHNLAFVFILIDGKLVPFFIQEISYRGKGKEAIITFEDIDTTEKARRLCDHRMYLPASQMPNILQHKKSYRDLIGFQAIQTDNTPLGMIDDVLEYPGNPVFRILKNQQEILIPASDDLIHNIDFKLKKVILSPPEGLLDLYL